MRRLHKADWAVRWRKAGPGGPGPFVLLGGHLSGARLCVLGSGSTGRGPYCHAVLSVVKTFSTTAVSPHLPGDISI